LFPGGFGGGVATAAHPLFTSRSICERGITLRAPGGVLIEGRFECNLMASNCIPMFHFSLAGGL
jgi:hypothetical protein